MSMFRLPDGREINLIRLHLAGTYDGCLEGDAVQNTPSVLRRLRATARETLPPAEPLAIIGSRQMPLPGWIWIAELNSSAGVQTEDPDFSSRLYVCWFSNGVGVSIESEVESILPSLNWERDADDYDVMMF